MVGHRYYNPEWGRWLSPDDIEYLDPESINGLNLYAYCNNDPVNNYDPTGHFPVALLIGTIIGAVTGGLTGAATTIASIPLMLGATFTIGAAGDIASQMVLDGKEFGDVNLIQSAWSGVVNATLAIPGKALFALDSVAKLTVAESVIFGTLTNSPLLGMGMALNTYISKNCGSFTLNDMKEKYDFWKKMNRRLF